MKPIRKMRLFAAALAVACLLAATVRTVAAGRGKAVLTGVVYGDGAPLAGVCVSDGVQFATTDAAGRYRIESDKSAGFVFAVTPSNWVAAEADGVQPLFWAALDEADARDEQHDFHFASVDQSRYTVMFFTDLHLTNSSEKRDLDHYRSIALASISDEAAQASARGPVYSLNLGDLSHDLYWYQYDFDVSSAKRFLEQNGFPTLLYSIPGNHDNDGATPAGAGVDRRAEHLYRRTFGPTYYAMNIGDVHWIMMDNIIYKNTPGKGKKNVGVVGARDYDKGFTPEQLAWLRRDLATVDASKTVCLCTHCPVFFDRDRRTLLTDRSQVGAYLFGTRSPDALYAGRRLPAFRPVRAARHVGRHVGGEQRFSGVVPRRQRCGVRRGERRRRKVALRLPHASLRPQGVACLRYECRGRILP